MKSGKRPKTVIEMVGAFLDQTTSMGSILKILLLYDLFLSTYSVLIHFGPFSPCSYPYDYAFVILKCIHHENFTYVTFCNRDIVQAILGPFPQFSHNVTNVMEISKFSKTDITNLLV